MNTSFWKLLVVVALAGLTLLSVPAVWCLPEYKDSRAIDPARVAFLAQLRSEALHGDGRHAPEILLTLRQAAAKKEMNEMN